MFQKGDLIVYGNMGVCRVEAVEAPAGLPGAGEKKLYYKLDPVYETGTVYIPVDAKVFMRPILTHAQAEALIGRIPEIEENPCGGKDQQMLAEHYRSLMRTHDCDDLVQLIKTIYGKNRERTAQGKKPARTEAEYMKRAEELAVSYSYVRPNGQRDFTVLAENGISDVSTGENYMAGCSTPDSAMDQWMATDFTRERILNADATTVSVGHYEGGAYNNYWVLIFSYPENSHTEDYRQEVLNLVNAQRAKYGLTALEMGDDNLTAAAQTRAEEIAVVNSHVRPDGSKCFTVLKDYGVTDTPTGENAAWGSVSPEEVVNAWMNSEGHRANILNPEARKMSVGYYYNSNSTWGHQWIQIFTK